MNQAPTEPRFIEKIQEIDKKYLLLVGSIGESGLRVNNMSFYGYTSTREDILWINSSLKDSGDDIFT